MGDEIQVAIATDADLVTARAEARALAQRLGFQRPDPTLIATAISELARNIVMHVGHGEIVMRPLVEEHRCGVLVIVRDEGPGIPDVEAALRDGHASRGGLGLGLPGARRLMDEFAVDCDPGRGTTISMIKWRTRDELELLRQRRGERSTDGRVV
jgi:serine/threonine-protein kinase RsbT